MTLYTTRDEDLRARADAFKPTTTQLRDEGLPEKVIQTLGLSRDALAIRMDPVELAEWMTLTHRHHPVTEADVFPHGKPAHWARCDECGLFLAFDDHDLCHREGDAPDHQWQVTTPEAVYAR